MNIAKSFPEVPTRFKNVYGRGSRKRPWLHPPSARCPKLTGHPCSPLHPAESDGSISARARGSNPPHLGRSRYHFGGSAPEGLGVKEKNDMLEMCVISQDDDWDDVLDRDGSGTLIMDMVEVGIRVHTLTWPNTFQNAWHPKAILTTSSNWGHPATAPRAAGHFTKQHPDDTKMIGC